MKTKLIIIIIPIYLINFVLSQSKENKDSSNPYLVFGVPPWTKFKYITKRFKKIKEDFKKKNSLNSMKFKKYEAAYEHL